MPGPLTLGQIVARLGGRVAGDPDTVVHQVASLENAGERHISFFTGARHRAKLDYPAIRRRWSNSEVVP